MDGVALSMRSGMGNLAFFRRLLGWLPISSIAKANALNHLVITNQGAM